MDGIENADSVCWDAQDDEHPPHLPAFILKDERLLRQIINNGRDAHYLLLDEASGLDLGRLSPACGRRNDALKLWMEWRAIGDVGWSDRVDGYMALADHLQQLVEASTSLEMVKWSDRGPMSASEWWLTDQRRQTHGRRRCGGACSQRGHGW